MRAREPSVSVVALAALALGCAAGDAVIAADASRLDARPHQRPRATTRVLTPGQSERLCVEIPAPSVETRVWVRVDAGGAARECDEGDNVAEVTVSCGPA